MDDLVGEVLDGKYRLVRLLGKGGMGAVYEAEHAVITRRVAVKIMRGEATSAVTAVERFVREAKAASAIGHPNIVEIHDVGCTTDGLHYIVMELLTGQSLSSYIRSQGSVPPGRALSLVLEMLFALSAAHSKGIIHRDLKPDNVFLARMPDGSEAVKLLDFGISKALDCGSTDTALTQTGTVLGTPVYMSPEQARGEKEIDARADIWSLGVVLYQMLSGKLPIRGDSYNEIISKILVEAVPPITAAVPDLPDEVGRIVDRALAKSREERFPTAFAFIEAIGSVRSLYTELADAQAFDVIGETMVTPDALRPVETARTGPSSSVSPAPSGPSGTSDTSASPLRKAVLWYALTLPFAWMTFFFLLLNMDQVSRGIFTIVGLPEDSPQWAAVAIAGIVSAGLTWAVVLTHRFWARLHSNRWLQGGGFLVFPALGLLATYRCHEMLGGRIETTLASFKLYNRLTEGQLSELLSMLGSAMAQYLNTSAMALILVTVLAYTVLLGYVFARPHEGGSVVESKRDWLILPVGLGLSVVWWAVLFDEVYAKAGFWTYLPPAFWGLTVYAAFKGRGLGLQMPAFNWHIVKAGLIAMMAVMVQGTVAGHIGLFVGLRDHGPDMRGRVMDNGVDLLDRFFILSLVEVGLLLALPLVVGRHRLGLRSKGKTPWSRSMLALLLATFIVTGLPFLFVRTVSVRMADVYRLPWDKPGLMEMVPAALKPTTEPSFYIDREPATLFRGAAGFHAAMAGEAPKHLGDPEELRALFSADKECSGVLDECLHSLHDGGGPAKPALCLTAIEARVYCESRGKRLPTPAEWQAALAEAPLYGSYPVEGTAGPVRGPFAEWTMTIDHGTPLFTVMGAGDSSDLPERPAPDKRFATVGFRCAFMFDED